MLRSLFTNEKFILFIIIVNGIVIFLNGFDLSGKYDVVLSFLDHFITLLFLVELFVKIIIHKNGFFKSSWNKFDFLLILISIPDLVAYLISADINEFSYLLIFRVIRVFKSFRFLKFVPGIDHLIKGIQRSLRASVIILLGFSVYIFITSIFSFYLFKESSSEYFPDPITAIYTTFKLFTVEGWYEIPETIASGLTPTLAFFTHLYFVFMVLSGGILGLSLVNSIFVDAMVSDNNESLEQKIDALQDKIDALIRSRGT